MKKYILSFILFGFALVHQASAGQETHGGDVLVCDDGTTTVLDHYYAKLPVMSGPHEIDNIEGMSTDEVIQQILSKVNGTLFGKRLREKLNVIGDVSKWIVAGNLNDIHDDGAPYSIPSNCGLEQAAVRSENHIYVDGNLINKLAPSELGILILHEAIYSLGWYLETSLGVKEIVRELLAKNISYELLSKSLNQFGTHLYAWEESYGEFCSKSNRCIQINARDSDFGKRVIAYTISDSNGVFAFKAKCPQDGVSACAVFDSTYPKLDISEVFQSEDMSKSVVLKYENGRTENFTNEK